MWYLTEKGKEYKDRLMDSFFDPDRRGRPTWSMLRELQALDDIDKMGITSLSYALYRLWHWDYVEEIEDKGG